MPQPWLPDYVARWYDDFCAEYPYGELGRWKGHTDPVRNTWQRKLRDNPHSAAVEMDKFIESSDYQTKEERRFQVLTAASGAFNEMGFRIRRLYGGEQWKSIRRHWISNGNLLREGEGYLLPREPCPFSWGWYNALPAHTPEACFPDFARWRLSENPNLTISVNVLPSSWFPSLDRRIKIGVVPLVASLSDFDLETDDTDAGFPCFRVSLKHPDVVQRAALEALARTRESQCDIVVYPELCLTPQIQAALSEHLRTAPGRRPWLVVAGSAVTPCSPHVGHAHYNQALVFGKQGKQVLCHHKLHEYSMDVDQQERYGVLEAFGHVDRVEDINTAPPHIEILDTPAGRMAVLICEDLSVEDFVRPLVFKLGLQWLFVPVLDGCQMDGRWTVRFGRKYSERGAAVVVATSLGMVKEHLHRTGLPGEPGVGAAVLPSPSGPQPTILSSSQHDEPAIFELHATE